MKKHAYEIFKDLIKKNANWENMTVGDVCRKLNSYKDQKIKIESLIKKMRVFHNTFSSGEVIFLLNNSFC